VVNGKTESYKYDAFGNLTEKGIAGATAVTIPVDPGSNRLIGPEYDAAGNVITRDGRVRYEYDSFNMLTYISGIDRRMIYDVNDERIGTILDDSVSRWTFRDFEGQALREFVAEDMGQDLIFRWEQDYIRGEGQLVGGESQPWTVNDGGIVLGGERHYHLDHLGSVRLLTDKAGRSLSENDYYPFGTAQTKSFQEAINWGDPHVDTMRFAGHARDFLGHTGVEGADYLDYMHARNYDPGRGRFLSVDPILGDPRAPQTWNRYTYANNNPINLTDPTGMCEQKEGEPPCSDMEITVNGDDVSDQEHYLWLQAETKETDEPFRGDPFSAHLFPNALWMSYQEKQQERLVGHPVTPGAGAMMMMMMMVGGRPSTGSGPTATAGRAISVEAGYVTAEGTALRFSERYYAKMQTRYGSPFLAAEEILATGVKIGPDPRGKPGFFLYRNGINEVVYNPSSGEVWHMQPYH
jgi:RHS repeat-associated protein